MEIRIGNVRDDAIFSLIQEHHENMQKHSPPESIHALDISALEQPNITFYSLWIDDELAGVGALKHLDDQHGEIKSMRTSSKHLRKGVAETILRCMLEAAQSRSYKRVSLETGTAKAFFPAHKLYQRNGFTESEPFGDYQIDPNSMYMSLDLN
ncbi:GNAT family N-acetyltransferase [Parashewanella tropica]|uniref:GNAT family N-acetyltransferase n=1 Tax=Parashewanella tropica TaxID=2547970 RepID=UPI001059A9CE|nr:GNAT family N-acetyltransferase [Parashewanella tropica]